MRDYRSTEASDAVSRTTSIMCVSGWLQAVTLFSQLRQEGLQPNAITFTTLMKAYQLSNQLDSAKATFVTALQEGQANIVASNAFIAVLIDNGQLQMASQVRGRASSSLTTPRIAA
jgi:hypothetical protein